MFLGIVSAYIGQKVLVRAQNTIGYISFIHSPTDDADWVISVCDRNGVPLGVHDQRDLKFEKLDWYGEIN